MRSCPLTCRTCVWTSFHCTQACSDHLHITADAAGLGLNRFQPHGTHGRHFFFHSRRTGKCQELFCNGKERAGAVGVHIPVGEPDHCFRLFTSSPRTKLMIFCRWWPKGCQAQHEMSCLFLAKTWKDLSFKFPISLNHSCFNIHPLPITLHSISISFIGELCLTYSSGHPKNVPINTKSVYLYLFIYLLQHLVFYIVMDFGSSCLSLVRWRVYFKCSEYMSVSFLSSSLSCFDIPAMSNSFEISRFV